MRDRRIRILIADDHPVVRVGLVAIIASDPRFELVGEACDGHDAVKLFQQTHPDVAMIDLQMPGLNGLDAMKAIRQIDSQAKVVIVTTFDGEEDIFQGLRAGAKAYILKDAPGQQLINCLVAVAQGLKFVPQDVASKLANRMDANELSPRELQVLTLMAKGKSNKEVARIITITEGTVKFHVNNILSKLNVACRTEAVTVAVRRGVVRLSEEVPTR